MQPQTTEAQSKEISKPEDLIIRRWIKQNYHIKLEQWALWKRTPAEAVQFLKGLDRATFSKVTEADIIKAARRE